MEWAEGSRDCICNILVLSMGYIKTDLFCLTQSQDEQIQQKMAVVVTREAAGYYRISEL